jgi:tetratricopeptide (TPR) repeat protein
LATAKGPVAEFRARLRNLRDQVGTPTYEDLDAHAAFLGDGRLPASTLSDLLTGSALPRWRTVRTFVRACRRHAVGRRADLPPDLFDLDRWQADYDCARGASAPSRSPTGRLVWAVVDFPPSAAGVHRAVMHTDPAGEGIEHGVCPPHGAGWWHLPCYVEREHDVELRERLAAAAADGGGFVLLTGTSCTGKTRSAWEAIRTVAFDGWQVVQPRDAAQVRASADSDVLRARTVVWLDELQRYLAEPRHHGLAAQDVQALWSQHTPVVVVGTLWPDIYDEILTYKAQGLRDLGGEARGVLELAGDPVRVPDRLRDEELDRARRLAATDRCLADALTDASHGMTQVLAGAPWLVQRWEQPRFTYTRCVLAAAAAAQRLGIRRPLPAELLRDAARGYFPDQRPAPRGWFRQGLAEAEQPIRDAVSALVPERDPDDDEQAIGYTVTDYLAQHTADGRGIEPVPEAVWQALSTHVTSPDDLLVLACQARSRMLYGLAERLCRQAQAGGHEDASEELVDLLTDQLRFDEAIEEERLALADGNDASSARLVSLLGEEGRLDELRSLAHTDIYARHALDLALIRHGSRKDVLDLARNSESQAVQNAALIRLAECGRIDDLRELGTAGGSLALYFAAELLARKSQFTEAIDMLRAYDTQHRHAKMLWQLLIADGRVEEALNELRRTDVPGLSDDLIQVLAQQRRFEELRALAEDRGHEDETARIKSLIANAARNALARLLHRENRTDEAIALLRHHEEQPDAFGERAATLAELLVESGRVDEALAELRRPTQLWSRQPDYRHMAMAAKLLVRTGRHEELRQLAEEGWPVACREWGKLLRDAGQIDEAQQQFCAAVSGGEYDALEDLGLMLTDQNRLEECYKILDCYPAPLLGVDYRAPLARRLAEQGRSNDLRRAIEFGNPAAEPYLAAVLAYQEAPDQLTRAAVSNDRPSVKALRLLTSLGHLDHADELRRFGLTPGGCIALDSKGTGLAIPTLTGRPGKDELIALAEIIL